MTRSFPNGVREDRLAWSSPAAPSAQALGLVASLDTLKSQAAAKKLAWPRLPPHAPSCACAWFPNTKGEVGSHWPRGGRGAYLPCLCPRAQNGGGLGTKSPRRVGGTPRTKASPRGDVSLLPAEEAAAARKAPGQIATRARGEPAAISTATKYISHYCENFK